MFLGEIRALPFASIEEASRFDRRGAAKLDPLFRLRPSEHPFNEVVRACSGPRISTSKAQNVTRIDRLNESISRFTLTVRSTNSHVN